MKSDTEDFIDSHNKTLKLFNYPLMPDGMKNKCDRLLEDGEHARFARIIIDLQAQTDNLTAEYELCMFPGKSHSHDIVMAFDDGEIFKRTPAASWLTPKEHHTLVTQYDIIQGALRSAWAAEGSPSLLFSSIKSNSLDIHELMILSEAKGRIDLEITDLIQKQPFSDALMEISRGNKRLQACCEGAASKNPDISEEYDAYKEEKEDPQTMEERLLGVLTNRDYLRANLITCALHLFDKAARINAQNPDYFSQVDYIKIQIPHIKKGLKVRQNINQKEMVAQNKIVTKNYPLVQRLFRRTAAILGKPFCGKADFSSTPIVNKWDELGISVAGVNKSRSRDSFAKLSL